jgi:hypothetical protein
MYPGTLSVLNDLDLQGDRRVGLAEAARKVRTGGAH